MDPVYYLLPNLFQIAQTAHLYCILLVTIYMFRHVDRDACLGFLSTMALVSAWIAVPLLFFTLDYYFLGTVFDDPEGHRQRYLEFGTLSLALRLIEEAFSCVVPLLWFVEHFRRRYLVLMVMTASALLADMVQGVYMMVVAG
ncbi:MAG: hypothetical protein ACOCXA_08095 [Planctomycetota bacterium]